MLTLKAAGYVDVEAGEIVRPGIVKVDGDRIVGIGGEPGAQRAAGIADRTQHPGRRIVLNL